MGRIIKDKIWTMSRHIFLSADNSLHGFGRAVEKVAFYFKLKRQEKAVMVILLARSLILEMQ